MKCYSEALEVNQKFFEVFTEEADRDDASYWKTFIPHKAMVDLLDALLRSLERGDAEPRSLWIHGAYGTGKTHAQFVLKHMLQDPWPEVQSYFESHRLSKDLQKRLEAVRGRGLVVYRSSSASINSNQKLMAELQMAIKVALMAAGYRARVGPSLYEQVVGAISAGTSAFDWERAFAKYRNEFSDFESAAEVARRLGSVSDHDERLELMERIVSVMEREHFVLADDPETVKHWLKDVIQANGLKWLLFMWDEFTDFFINVSTLTGLQELAHLTKEAPFYLLLATHRSPEVLQGSSAGRDKDWRKLLERFAVTHYEMEPITAYRLMRNVVRPRPGAEKRWEEERVSLWDAAKPVARHLDQGDKAQDLEMLVPIHPYSAYLLSQISREFSSSQRTLFRFLKRSEKGSFMQFLREYPRAGWGWYTADSLWDYFFSADTVALPDSMRDVVGYYRSRRPRVETDEEERALKAALLLIGLSRGISDVPSLQPTLSNLRWIFHATPLAHRIDDVMHELSQRELVRAIRLASNDRQYTIPTGNVDHEAIKRYREMLRFATEAASQGRLGSHVLRVFDDIDDVPKRRQDLTIVAAQELGRRAPAKPAQPWQTHAVIAIGLDEAEVKAATAQARALAAQDEDSVFAVLEVPFGQERWNDWCEDVATARWYAEDGDKQNAVFHDDTALNRVRDWLKLVRAGSLRLFFRDKDMRVAGLDGYLKAMAVVTETRFPLRPERICATATLYRESYGVKGAEIGLGTGGQVQAPYSLLVDELRRQGLWPDAPGFDPEVYRTRPQLTFCGMKLGVELLLQRLGADTIDLNALYRFLQGSPFGLLPSPASITLMGLLLRDYVDGYYWHDGVNTRPLDRTKMAELINAVMKGTQQVILTRRTEAAEEFCSLLRSIFDLKPEDTRYPENAREALRRHLTATGYPIWALRYSSPTRLESLPLLEQVLGDTNDAAVVLSADRIGNVVHKLRADRQALKSVADETSFEQGMQAFFRASQPALLDRAKRVGLTVRAVAARLRNLMNEEVWLWKEAEVAKRLPALQAELEAILGLNGVLGQHHTELAPALTGLRRRLQQGKLPLVVFEPQLEGREHGDQTGLLVRGLQSLLAGKEVDSYFASVLYEQSDRVRSVLEQRVDALRRWVECHLNETLTPEEGAHLLDLLPDLSEQVDTEALKDQIGARLRELARRRLVDDVKRAWEEISGSPSPQAWSADHGVPVQWVLDTQPYLELLALVQAPSSRSEEELSRALAFMNSHRQELAVLSDTAACDRALASVALGPYGELVRTPHDVADLRACLLAQHGPEVYDWDRGPIAASGRQWAMDLYERELHPEVVDLVERTPEAKLKALVKELVADPLVGLKLLRQRRKG